MIVTNIFWALVGILVYEFIVVVIFNAAAERWSWLRE